MPYNTAPIAPRQEVTGQAQLPLARVKKIIGLDSDIAMCSNNAAFVITLATEMFIQYMAEQGHNVVKSEKKPRRNIQYRDLAQAVALHDSLQFLEDIVPRTVPYSQVKGNIQKRAKGPPGKLVEAGQMTLDGKVPAVNGSGANGDTEDAGDEESAPADPSAQLEMEIRGMRTSTGSVEAANGTVEKHEDRSGVTQDVEMMEL